MTSVSSMQGGETGSMTQRTDAPPEAVRPVATETPVPSSDGSALTLSAPASTAPAASTEPNPQDAPPGTAHLPTTAEVLAPATPTGRSTPFPDAGRARRARFAPSVLVVPRIGIEAVVVPVGVTPDGQLEAPVDYRRAGWYQDGPAPGEPGRAILDGHVDSRTGPAVFYRLRELRHGDEITIRLGGTGEVRTFVVRESSRYWTDEVPLDLVYGPSDRPELVLITCAGRFDRGGGGYQQRQIVIAAMHDGAGE